MTLDNREFSSSSDERLNVSGEIDSDNPRGLPTRLIVLGIAVLIFAALFFLFRRFMNLEFLVEQELSLKELYAAHPVLFLGAAFAIYALVTGLSIPGATFMSLLYAWFFGFWTALVLVSFASTTGATIAFLLSRYLARDWVQNSFETRLSSFNEALEKEGPFYLFTLRLIPAVPFFVINAVSGLTKMSVATFWLVSQIGMLAGTAVYVYAGSRIPDLQTLSEKGLSAVFTASQITQLFVAFALIGVFPIVVRKLLQRFKAA